MKQTSANATGEPTGLALEKVPVAAQRAALSVSGIYREIRNGRIGPLVKLGARASAVPSASVDAYISDRIAEAGKSAKTSVLGAKKNLGRGTLAIAGSLGIVSFQKDRQPLRSRMTAIDGPGFHEYHDAQLATLLPSAMWVSLSLGVSAPG